MAAKLRINNNKFTRFKNVLTKSLYAKNSANTANTVIMNPAKFIDGRYPSPVHGHDKKYDG
jgi:hypothetical protein